MNILHLKNRNGVTHRLATPAATRRFVYNDPRVPQFVAASVGSTDCQAYASFGVEILADGHRVDGQPGKIVAGVVFDNFTGTNIFMHFSRDDGHRIGRDFLKLIFGYAFEALKVQRITGACWSTNERVKNFAQKLGFVYETKLEDGCPDGDLLFYVMRRAQCRHLIDWSAAHLEEVRKTNG